MSNLQPTDRARLQALADDYEAGTAKAIASGYEEFGPIWQHDRELIIKAMRAYASDHAPCTREPVVGPEFRVVPLWAVKDAEAFIRAHHEGKAPLLPIGLANFFASLIAQPPVRSSDAGERIHALAIDLTLKGWCATENEINRITKEAERKLLDFACDEIKRHMDRAAPVTQSAATSKQVPAFGMMKANGDLLPCAVAEEDAIYHVCAPMFDVSAEYVRAKLEAAGWHTVRVQISIDPTDPLARNDRGSPSNG